MPGALLGPMPMRLVNTTPLTADLSVAQREDGTRSLRILAKATFHFAAHGGSAWIEGSNAEPIRTSDEVGAEGTIPRDDQLPDDGRFEVFFCGDAVVPGLAARGELDVALSVDDTRRTLKVFGDRFWSHAGADATASASAPFVRMPIAQSTTFGGTTRVEVDEGTIVTLADERNPRGKGFIVDAQAEGLSKHLGATAPYPKLPLVHPLANVEHPHARVTSPEARPRAAHWTAHPLDYKPASGPAYSLAHRPVVDLGRAHPDWQLGQRVALPRSIRLEHLSADAAELEVRLPPAEVTADVLSGGATKSISLWPRRLFVMPNVRRIAALFAATLTVDRPGNDDRALRLRWEEAAS